MRRLHCGNDALAQLLNLLFGLSVDRESKGFPGKVANKLWQQPELRGVYNVAKNMLLSPEFMALSAFVNHVKHVGFPERRATAMPDGLDRATEVGAFSTESGAYGPWSPSDLNTIIDGVRRHMIAVVDSAVEVVR